MLEIFHHVHNPDAPPCCFVSLAGRKSPRTSHFSKKWLCFSAACPPGIVAPVPRLRYPACSVHGSGSFETYQQVNVVKIFALLALAIVKIRAFYVQFLSVLLINELICLRAQRASHAACQRPPRTPLLDSTTKKRKHRND